MDKEKKGKLKEVSKSKEVATSKKSYLKSHWKTILAIVIPLVLIILGTIFSFSPLRNVFSGFVIQEENETNLSDVNETNVTEPEEIIEPPVIQTISTFENITNQTPPSFPSGGGGGSSNGEPSCTPSKTCLDYPGLCGTSLSNGCENILDCSDNCDANFTCFLGECIPPSIQISSCQLLDKPTIYILNTSINNNNLTDNCMNIITENTTLDCNNSYINSNQSFAGVYSDKSNITIKNCNITMGTTIGGAGIKLISPDNSNIFNNILNSQYEGLYLESTSSATITNNTMNNNWESGIHLISSSNIIVTNNTANNNWKYGIDLYQSSSNLIQNNILNENEYAGIYIYENISLGFGGSNQILNNFLFLNSWGGMEILSSHNIIRGNFINRTDYIPFLTFGLRLWDNANNTIQFNNITNCQYYGLTLINSDNNTITYNIIANNSGYIGIENNSESTGNIIGNNTF